MNAAILGYGTVGGGVYEILKDRPDISVKYVLDKALVAELGAVSVTDFSVILNDAEVDTVVEVMGGLEPAYEYITAAMRAAADEALRTVGPAWDFAPRRLLAAAFRGCPIYSGSSASELSMRSAA